jgi:glutathione S-transferase
VIDREDRSLVRRLSGQDLVPVVDDDGTIVFDSTRILAYLEERYPQPPLYPADPARRAELEVFLDWFDRVWKRPPNEIDAELGKPQPDRGRIEQLGRVMAGTLDLFEALLGGRDYLFGELSAADCAAFPFLKYALIWPDGDRELFHEILRDYQPLGPSHPQLEAWIGRIDALPRA